MLEVISYSIRRSWNVKALLLFVAVMSAWWGSIYFRGLTEGTENNAFTLIYALVPLWGGIVGLVTAKKWGGMKSVLGRSLIMFSLGLLGQFLGQALYSYYIYVLGIDDPYPSIGDAGFFSTGFFYVYGLILLAKAVGVRFSLQSIGKRIQAFIIPLIILAVSYELFLSGYSFESSSFISIVLDFGYPIVNAVYVSIAILIFLLSRKTLGGIMRGPLLILIVALVLEYVADSMFDYQVNNDLWYVGGTNDYTYLLAYGLMTFSLIHIGSAFRKAMEN